MCECAPVIDDDKHIYGRIESLTWYLEAVDDGDDDDYYDDDVSGEISGKKKSLALKERSVDDRRAQWEYSMFTFVFFFSFFFSFFPFYGFAHHCGRRRRRRRRFFSLAAAFFHWPPSSWRREISRVRSLPRSVHDRTPARIGLRNIAFFISFSQTFTMTAEANSFKIV